MRRFIHIIGQTIAIFLIVNATVNAQVILPENGATLTHTQLMFDFEPVQDAGYYVIEIETCNEPLNICKSFFRFKSKVNTFLITDKFKFAQNYKWRYYAYKGRKVLYKSTDYYFRTGWSDLLDTNVQKLVWTVKPKKKEKGIVVLDALKLAVNLKGEPVYYLNYNYNHAVRDINLTKQNTITMVDNRLGEVKELKLNGEVIWNGPSNLNDQDAKTDRFHHELEKLTDGTYIAAGKRSVRSFEPEEYDITNVPGNIMSETIVAFDKENNEVWRFNLLPELRRQFNLVPDVTVFNPTRLGHLNGIAVDEENQLVYASFKTFNTIMRIHKPTNNINYLYGAKKINFQDSLVFNAPFEQQHAPFLMQNGNLVIFNNGNDSTGSGIVFLNTAPDVNPANEVIKQIWFKSFLKNDYYGSQMGSVQPLGNNNYLVCMGAAPHVFSFNEKSKKVNWQLYTYHNKNFPDKVNKNWKSHSNYRAYYYSSLYQYYFSANMVNKGSKSYVQIINSGTNIDTFDVLDDEGIVFITKQVKPKSKVKFEIANELLTGNKSIAVKSVQSGKVVYLKAKQ
jgi:hypothetical protein